MALPLFGCMFIYPLLFIRDPNLSIFLLPFLTQYCGLDPSYSTLNVPIMIVDCLNFFAIHGILFYSTFFMLFFMLRIEEELRSSLDEVQNPR
jgi:hypothetical protein